MRKFAALFQRLDNTTSTLLKVEALRKYFTEADPADAAWALFFLSGRTVKRTLPTAVLIEAALKASHCARWLFDESYAEVGDLAETIALLVPAGAGEQTRSLREWVETRVIPLKGETPEVQQANLMSWWRELETRQIFLVNKLLTGSFRAGVSHTLVVRALSQMASVSEAVMSHRLMGTWSPSPAFFQDLITQKQAAERDPGTPYPFYLASPLTEMPDTLGEPGEWLAEWKWDGIRAQAVHREGMVFLWSRGEELITERFPELAEELARLPAGTVIDGEVLGYLNGEALPFLTLQQRIGRKKLTPKILQDIPVSFMAFDLLEVAGQDLRELPLKARRQKLEALLAKTPLPHFQISPALPFDRWDDLGKMRDQSRERKVEGLMLKRHTSPYKTGRRRGDWWKWKVAPHTMDAVLIYAQPGHGRRATLYTDYTFAIWKGPDLVPIAKAYSGLTDAEILDLDRWIRKNTKKKFGPVREVPPEKVFELAFEAIAPSNRHKSGLAVRFPRILRVRDDKQPKDADTVETVKELLRVA